jgi:hypothetical protein
MIALQYDERFKLGLVDGGDVKALRKRTIDAMAKFDMSEVKVGTHAESKRNEFPMLRPSRSRASRHSRGSACPLCGGRRRWRLRWPWGRRLWWPRRQHRAIHLRLWPARWRRET